MARRKSKFWNKARTYRPVTLLQQLEERIVLDASVNPTQQDNPNDHPGGQADQNAAAAGDHAPAGADTGGGHADGNAGLAANVPDSYAQVFNKDLNVVIVANNLADVNAVTNAATAADAKVIVVDAAHDNLSTVTAKLQDLVNSVGHKIDNLAIVGHGSQDLLNIGLDQIQLSSVAAYQPTFEVLGQTLSSNAQIQFYGCSLAGNVDGQALVNSIATFTAATVYASTDTTGGNAHDWTLEYSTNSTAAMHAVLNVDSLAGDNTPLAAPSVLKALATDGSSAPANYVEMGGKIYFAADDAAHGKEIWVYDPSNGSTTMLVDLNTTGYSSINQTSITSNPLNLTVVGGNKLFFTATDTGIVPIAGQHGQELWMYDGTTVQLVKDINLTGTPATASSNPGNLVDVNGVLYFTATDGTSGVELWRSDGTAVGTVMVKDIYAGATSSNPANLTYSNNTLFFTATDAANGLELWKSDGTGTGTVLVANIMAGATGSSITSLTNVNNTLYFAANNGTTGLELWKSDGTGAGTVLVKDILPGTTGSSLANFTAVGNTLYFSATDGTTGVELWKSDGSTAGTVQVKDINVGAGASSPTGLTNINGTLYFAASDGTAAGLHGTELWKSDGTAGGTVMVKDIISGTGSSGLTGLTNINGTLYFAASDGTTTGLHGTELWKSDGTDAGTVMVTDIYSGTTSSGPTGLTNVGGKLAFTANGWAGGYNDGATGNEPWYYDPTAGTPTLMKDIMLSHAALNSGDPGSMMNVNGIFYWFQYVDSVHGMKLWRYDGNTTMAVTGIASISSQAMANVNGDLYIVASDGTGTGQHGTELMKVDANGNAVLVKDITLGTASSNIGFNGSVDNLLFFNNSGTPWQTNGTDAGTIQVTGPAGFTFGSGMANQFTNVNGTIYFQGYTSTTGWELFKTTGNGTVSMVADINPALGGGSNILGMTNLNGTLLFSASNGTSGQELWKVDALGNAVMVQDLNPGTGASSPSNLTIVNNTLFFSASNGVDGIELYKTDGTTITRVADINPTAGAGSNPFNFVNINGTLYFTATNGVDGTELWWTSDGVNLNQVNINTAAGGSSSPQYLTNAGGTLVFAAADATNGLEPWAYDPTNGLRSLGNINPTPGGGSLPQYFTYIDGTTYFRAMTSQTSPYNQELYQWTGAGDATLAGGAEIYPGPYANGNPINLTAVNNSLIFRAANIGGNSLYGDQIWKLDGAGNNHAPTVTINAVANALEDGGAVNLGSAMSVTDDLGDTITVTLSLDRPAAGSLSVSGAATYNDITGFWKITGTQAEVSAALSSLTFAANADWNGAVNITTHVEDGKGVAPSNGLITFNVTAVNDAPITGNLDTTTAEDNSIVISGWTFSDAKDQVPGGSSANTPVSVNIVTLPANGTLYDNGVAITAPGTVPWADATGGLLTFVPAANWNGSTSFTFSVTDSGDTLNGGQNTSATATTNLTVTAVNDAPVNTGLPTAMSTDENTPVVLGGVSIADVDLNFGTPSQLYTVTLTTAKSGVDTGTIHVLSNGTVSGNDTGAVTLTGTLADINTALAGLTFVPYAENFAYSGTSNAIITMVTSDAGNIGSGNVLTATNTVDFTVAPVPDTPVNTVTSVDNIPTGTNVVSLAGHLSVHDGDVNDTLFVKISAGNGVSGIGWGAFAPSQQFMFAGMESFLVGPPSLFNNLVAYIQPGFSGQATVQVTTSDALGNFDTDPIFLNITVPSLPPVITPGAPASAVEDQPGSVNLGSSFTVSDANGDNLSVTVQGSAAWTDLSANALGGAGVVDGGTSLLISGPMAGVNATLATLQGTLATNFNGNASFSVTANDGTHPDVNATIDVPVAAVNDAPTVTVPGVQSGNANTPLAITGIGVADLDVNETAPLNNVVYVQLSAGNGTVSLADTNGLTFDTGHGNGTGSVWFTGNLSYVSNALSTVTYNPNLNFYGTDSVSVYVNDNGHTGPGSLFASDSVSVDIAAPPLPPSATNLIQSHTIAEDSLPLNLTDIVVTDPNAGDTITATLTLSNTSAGELSANNGATYNAGTGAWTISDTIVNVNTALANVTFTPALNFNGAISIVTHVQDAAATGPADGLITVNVTPVNDPPTATNLVQLYTVAQGSGALNLTDIVVTDVDAGDTITATLTVGNVASGALSANNGASYNAGTGVWTISDTLANVNTALANVTFTPDVAFSGTATITTHVQDAAVTGPADGSITVDVTPGPVNNPPTATNLTQAHTIAEDSLPLNLTDIVVTDLDATDTITATLTLSNTSSGALSNNDGATYNAVTGVWSITGTQASVNTALQNVTFAPALNFNGAISIVTHVQDAAATGPADGVITVDVTPVNDPPTATNLVQLYTVAQGSGALNLTDIVVTDVDAGDTITATLTVGNVASGALSANDNATYNAGTGVWTISDTLANINTALANVTFTPDAAFSGTATITTHVQDAAATGPADGLITVDVTPIDPHPGVNDAPVATVPAVQTTAPGTLLTFSSANLNAISVSDVDAGAGQIWVALQGTHGTVSLSQTTGLTITAGTGTNDALITFKGNLTDINAALQGMTFNPTAGFQGAASILVQTYDFGNTGSGGPLYGANQTVAINVQTTVAPAVPVAGNFQASVNEDAAVTLSGWNFTDANGDAAQSILVTNLPGSGTLFRDANANNQFDAGEAVVVNTEISWADAVTAPKVKYLGNANFNGSDSLTYVVKDVTGQQGSTPAETGTVTVNIAAVNDAPVATVPGAASTAPGVPLVFNSISVSDVDAGSNQLWIGLEATHGTVSLSQITGLTITYGTGVNDGLITFKGNVTDINAALQGLSFAPTAGFTGAASLKIMTYDFGNTGSGGALYGIDKIVNINVA
jgi:ELWxxDGT repeat protein